MKPIKCQLYTTRTIFDGWKRHDWTCLIRLVWTINHWKSPTCSFLCWVYLATIKHLSASRILLLFTRNWNNLKDSVFHFLTKFAQRMRKRFTPLALPTTAFWIRISNQSTSKKIIQQFIRPCQIYFVPHSLDPSLYLLNTDISPCLKAGGRCQ